MKKIMVGLVLVGLVMFAQANAQGYLGFRLLHLEGHYVKWSNTEMGRGADVTYAFVTAPTRFSDARNCQELGPIDPLLSSSRIPAAQFRSEVSAAFRMWEAVANISFRQSDDPSTAGILIGTQVIPLGRAFANVSYGVATGAVRQIERSLVCLNPRMPWKIGFDGNMQVYDLRYTVAHEIGHAIGLDHPQASGVLMSYRYDERIRDLQSGDIEGAVALYGSRKRHIGAAAVK